MKKNSTHIFTTLRLSLVSLKIRLKQILRQLLFLKIFRRCFEHKQEKNFKKYLFCAILFSVYLVGGETPKRGNVFAINPTTGVNGPVCDDFWDLIDVSKNTNDGNSSSIFGLILVDLKKFCEVRIICWSIVKIIF